MCFIHNQPLFLPPLQGVCWIGENNEIVQGPNRRRIDFAFKPLAHFCVVLKFDSGKKVILWRDSVCDKAYRQVMVQLNKGA